jgi:hypothetical protein
MSSFVSRTGIEFDPARRNAGVVFGGLGPIAVAALLVGVRGEVQNANVALVLVVVVVAAAAIGGRGAGAVAAIAAALSFAFFHTRPYLRLTVASSDDIETTALLLVVGLLVGHIATSGWRARAAAAASSDEIRRIHRIADEAARGESTNDVILAAEDEIRQVLALRSCRFEPGATADVLARVERDGHVETRVWRLAARGFELPTEGVELPVYGRGQQLGRFVLKPAPGVGVSPEQRLVAVAIADQVGAALAAARSTGETS